MARAKKHTINLNTSQGSIEAEYKEHTYVKFPYVYLNIVVYKPGMCEVVGYNPDKKHYADAVITIGKSAKNPLTAIGYDDLPLIKEAIDDAIKTLNAEKDGNDIDPTKVTNFQNFV